MREWTRDALQDCLPDLLHGRLSASEAAEVERAVAADPELTAELAILRRVQGAIRSSVPSVDVARIVSALPRAPIAQQPAATDDLAVRRAANARRPLISHRFARAAALLVVVGGGTMVTVWNTRRAPAAPSLPPVAVESTVVAGDLMQLGFGASTDELSTEQLRALEIDIQSLDGIPSADPDVTIDLLDGESTS
jgi:anti-sigma factor RsiW